MTTIAYRDGILAADTRGFSGASTPIGNKLKIHRLKDNSLIGISTSTPGFSEMFINWMNDDDELKDTPHSEPDFVALHITEQGVFYYCNYYIPSGPITADYYAVGSGCQYAYGAFAMGASAEEAIRAAMEFDGFTAGNVETLQFKKRIRK